MTSVGGVEVAVTGGAAAAAGGACAGGCLDVQLAALRERGVPGVHLNVNTADGRFVGLCYHLGFTGLRPGDRHILSLKPRYLPLRNSSCIVQRPAAGAY